MSDFTTNFCFGRGVAWDLPSENEAVIRPILERVWKVDNDQPRLLWEIGQTGSICGDVFAKVAYEEPWRDPAGNLHKGRLRILPLNPSFCFPEWHPHDRERMIRFKLKYRFWGTTLDGTRQVFTYTELITDEAVEEYINDELISAFPNPLGEIPIVHVPNLLVSSSPWGMPDITDIISLNRQYNETATQLADIIDYHACVDEETEILTTRGWLRWDEVTPNDPALTLDLSTDQIHWEQIETINVYDYDGPLVAWDNHIDALTTPNHRWAAERRYGRAQEYPLHRRAIVRTSEATAEDMAVADLPAGSRLIVGGGAATHFPTERKWDDELVETVGWWVTEGSLMYPPTSIRPASTISQSVSHNPSYVERLRRLQAYWQGQGATFTEQRERANGVVQWYLGADLTELLLSVAPNKSLDPAFLTSLTYAQALLLRDALLAGDGTGRKGKTAWAEYGQGHTWYQDDPGRRGGLQMLLAMIDGTRSRSFLNNRGDGVVEVHARKRIRVEETVRRAAEIPYTGKVWCPTVPSGFWFARRNGSTYWTGNSPTTVIVGAKASNLEKGARKVWAGLPADAQVYNLEMASDAGLAQAFMQLLKQAMHEMSGIPVTALGQEQAVSNTSGVALQIQYQPMMMKFQQKTATYGKGLARINELALKTLALKEPEVFVYDPSVAPALKDGQLPILDRRDPTSYLSRARFQSPLPIDKLIVLNEIMSMMQLGLESKRGALQRLGVENPDEKLQELVAELVQDAKEQGVLDLLKAQIADVVGLTTFSGAAAMGGAPAGQVDPTTGGNVTSAGGPDVNTASGSSAPTSDISQPLPGIQPQSGELLQQLSDMAAGTKIPQRRVPDSDNENS